MNYSYLLTPTWKHLIDLWLQEDMPSFDYSNFIVEEQRGEAKLLGKSKGILAGVPFFTELFKKLDVSIEWHMNEGDVIEPVIKVATISGLVRNILIGERTALNILSRTSGIATQASDIIKLAQSNNYSGKIAGTRKTTPGLRLVEKYALLVGGADTHRMDLSSMIMLKDNHISALGSISEAVAKARSLGNFSLKIEVECQNFKEAEEAIQAKADIIMLDNFSPKDLKETAKTLKQKYQTNNFLIEASGGITKNNISNYFSNDVDIISLGSLTQDIRPVDFSLKIK